MNALNIAVSQRRPLSGSLLNMAVAEYRNGVTTRVLDLGVSVRRPAGGRVAAFGFSARARQGYPFAGSEALGIGDYNLAVYIGGAAVDMCEMAESMSITHGENESCICDFVLRKNKGGRPRPIDLYQWYSQDIIVEAVHAGGRLRLYTGIVNSVRADFAAGALRVGCSDRRERLIEALPPDTIAAIGITSEAAHGKFLSKADELNKRLETVPASFEFDAYGRGALVAWKPSAPVRTLDDCTVYFRQPELRLAEVGQVVNTAVIELNLSYERLLERRLNYSLALGINVCEYARYEQLPTLEAVREAARQTGWTLGGFVFEREEKSGWKHCGGPLGHLRRRDSTAITGGSFEMVKRWRQPVSERHKVVIGNRASVVRYGELAENLSYAVSAPPAQDWEKGLADPHEKQAVYTLTTTDRFHAHPLPAPQYGGQNVPRADNGDFVLAASAGAEESLLQTWRVAVAAARTRIAASHRQNTLDLEIKFLPEISLRHSHRIAHRHFRGTVKVARFVHTFDFESGTGQTAVQYRFFQNAGGGEAETDLSRPPLAPPLPLPAYNPHLHLGKVLLEPNQSEDGAAGMIYRKIEKSRLLHPLMFRITVPDVEQQSTDTAEQEFETRAQINVPHDDVEVFL